MTAQTAIKVKEKEKFDLSQHLRKYGALYAFVALFVIDSVMNKNFLKVNTMWNLVIQVFPILFTAFGMLLVISTGGIDISVGSSMAVAGAIAGKIITGEFLPGVNGNTAVAMVLAMLVTLIIGFLNGLLVAKFDIQPIIVTLVTYIAGRGVAQLLCGGRTLAITNTPFNDLGLFRLPGKVPLQFILEIALILIFFFVIKKTVFGYQLQAIGENVRAARLSGVRTGSVMIAVYVISAFMASIAGLFTAARTSCADPTALGALAEMDAIAAVVIGGTSMSGGKTRIAGTIFGAFIIQLISITINMNNIHYAYARILKGVIIIVAVYLQREKKR